MTTNVMTDTLEESGRIALRAASSGDLDELRTALASRERALAELRSATPDESVRKRLLVAQEIGDAVTRELRALKRRLAQENARLEQARGYFK